jgi:ribonuclease HII
MMDRPTFDLEKAVASSLSFCQTIVGIDEAGCGPLAGPVVAGAVIFLTHDRPETLQGLINDSKKLTEKKRKTAFEKLEELNGTALHVGVGVAQVEEIDRLNIGQATRLAMERAVAALKVQPDFALIDGIRKPTLPCPAQMVVKGDARSLSIAAASIVAKVTRDQLMKDLDTQFPAYGWGKNAGYGTAAHIAALHAWGITPHHRRSFEPVKTISLT